MSKTITAVELKSALHDGGEIALLDVREHGQFGEAHLFYATPLPYSRLELEIHRLVPRKSIRVVVYDSGDAQSDSVATRAALRLEALGYVNVMILEGGTRAWAQAGYKLFAGVNLPSKTFGELVEHAYHTPRISAQELARKQAAGEPLAVFDGRPTAEFRKMNIPGAVCCPNGELAYRIKDLVPDDTTPIVINCAGRTRSIIGAQTLINLGIPNPVYALENGTQGWYLADLPLQHGRSERYGDETGSTALLAQARALAERFDVPYVTAQTVRNWEGDATRSLFLCDVRTPEEFQAGSLPGAQHTPGGQLIQAIDQYVGVRGARLVIFDNDGVRAPVVASWLRQMGHDANVLIDGLSSGLALQAQVESELPTLAPITVAQLKRRMEQDDVAVVDIRAGMQYRKAHIPGARWSIRPRLASDLRHENREIVLVADELAVAQLAATELDRAVLVLEGGMAAWQAAGHAVVSTPDRPSDEECIDYLFFVHDRHDGNKEAARQYLAWETGLVAQLDASERGNFSLPATYS
ncbi:rhodanese-like domain-containing protein [Bordetella sp. 15P40C-2]|uniref:rhodanese-like domain-containing protein n=1 Tax=Bordetella sp. 15P40C-2 TaxID=2572246 RepID=UPI00132825D5|nr:rhodanese-like domain-containing protein [Bordetella sp. 15P40C-2]MVW72738.1 sulfurtransferase [Bordetella sp. 15P40C-2]